MCVCGSHPRTFISAAITHKNRVISYGTNQMKTHPFQVKYQRNAESIFLHAEIAAIKNALRFIDVEDLLETTLYVCRQKYIASHKKQMISGLAKPCEGCARAIIEFGIKKVIYTTDEDGVFETL
jgi:deoxycytidylate deaminase